MVAKLSNIVWLNNTKQLCLPSSSVVQDLITSKIGLSSSILRALNESFSISSKFAHMWDWNEAGLSPHSLNMQEKNCMAVLIRGGETREDVY